MIKDAIGNIKAIIDETTGFLTAPVTLARVGVQHYSGMELGIKDQATKMFGVYRPESEVFDPVSIDSFVNLVSTNDHPNSPVTTDNVKSLQVGTVSGVMPEKGNGVISGVLTVTDKKMIDKVKAGKNEVSVGYAHDLKEESGEFNGVKYDYVQTGIRANHLAIVDAGRCGSACKITLDDTKEKTMVITIDGINYNVEDQQLAQAIQKQQSAYDAEKEKMKKEKEDAEKEKEEAIKEKDKAEAAKDSLTADAKKFTDDAIKKMVADKAVLLTTARSILGDKMPECVTCDSEIKAAVIEKVDGKDVSGKSDDYIQAMFDMSVEKFDKVAKANGRLNKDFASDENKDTRQTSHDAYVKNLTNPGGE